MDIGKNLIIPAQTELKSDGAAEEQLRQIDEEQRYDPTYDKRDMRRLGRKQELKRRFRYSSLMGYMLILGCCWENVFLSSVFSLPNGGTAGTIWMTLLACIGQASSTLSMAEMASISPTAGGQYHWCSEFSHPKHQKPMSYLVGWLCALGWQTAMPSVAYATSLQVLALIATCKPDYVAEGWHGALLTIAFTLFAMSINIFAINKLPFIEGLVVIAHISGFFAFLILLWVMGARTPAYQTFFTFTDENGWGSYGLASLVSLVGPASSLIGADAAVHLAEELEDAAYVLPRAMVSSAVFNYVTSFIMVITFVSAIGDNLNAVLASNTGQPWVTVVYLVTGSKQATIVLTVLMGFLFTFTSVNMVTTSSRQLWAFARDKGVPFHRTLGKVSREISHAVKQISKAQGIANLFKVDEKDGIPRNALFVTLGTTVVVSCIIIGSTTAFNNIVSLCNVSLVVSYMCCIGTLIARRLRGEKLPPSRFDLGRAGLWINIFAMCWLALLQLFLFFPPSPRPTAATMNWACLMFGGVMIFAGGWYMFRARYEYDGPVEYIRKDVE